MDELVRILEAGKALGLTGEEVKAMLEKQRLSEEEKREADDRKLALAEDRQIKEYERQIKRDQDIADREDRNRSREEKRLESERIDCEKEREQELEKMKYENDRLQAERKHALELARLKSESGASGISLNENQSVPKIPYFNEGEDDIDSYLHRFEKLAAFHKWDKDDYAYLLGTYLRGRALRVYTSLPDTVADDYDRLKLALLNAFQVNADTFRWKFKNSVVGENESYVQLVSRMDMYLNRWVELSEITKDFKSLFGLLIRDQILCNCPPDMRTFLKAKKFANTLELAESADLYANAHESSKKKFSRLQRLGKDGFRLKDPTESSLGKLVPAKEMEKGKGKDKVVHKFDGKSSEYRQVVCYYCGKTGHTKRMCYYNPDNYSEKNHASKDENVKFVFETEKKPESIITDAKGLLFNKTVEVMVDTGATCVIVNKNVLPSKVNYLKPVKVLDYLGRPRIFPRVRCYLNCKFFRGWVNAVVAPIKFGEVLLGLIPGLKVPEIVVSDSISSKVDNGIDFAIEKANVVTRSEVMKVSNVKPLNNRNLEIKVDPVDFAKEQETCETLSLIRDKVKSSEVTVVKGRTVVYQKINNLIYRVCTKSKIANEVGKKQIVVPKKFRIQFTAKGRVKKVPLKPMPIISEPFSRIAVDLVGPLSPVTTRGHRYILTIVDCATRFPEAVPLKNIDTVTVAESLIEVFCRVGIPREILSDRGTQFKADLMKEINRLLSIKALFTSPYHACCNGLVERMNGVLKNMLKKLCSDHPQDWDRYLPAVLFAYREIPNDTLKFSPFELLYGRTVRGPLSILYELWTNENLQTEVKNSYKYVLDLRDKLAVSSELAIKNAEINSNQYKKYFDRFAKPRRFQVGDDVLLLLPDQNNKFLMKWLGPYKVVECHQNKVDYWIMIGNKKKLYHINLLKKYFHRDSESVEHVNICVIEEEEIDNHCKIETYSIEINSIPNINDKLSSVQRRTLHELVNEYVDVLSDQPGFAKYFSHDIILTSDIPVQQKQYPIPHSLDEVFKVEVDYLLKMGIVEPSKSAYCSPVIFVKKEDKSWRLCIDFRKLNDITLFDCEPMPTREEALHCFTDASDYGIGAVLLQKVDDIPLPVAYASRSLLPREQRYSAVERECLAVVWSVSEFYEYLYGEEFTIQTDHHPLYYLKQMKNQNNRLMRWALALQDFGYTIEYIKGSENVGADMLSRLIPARDM
ncbi:uncharacterized protein [Macrobrachium rosenbergii]|uniref:uncharacterized protein n=1 Tax=Macrobrachium rosenbergii TaxID=79674 RepID=UPI0034D3EE54